MFLRFSSLLILFLSFSQAFAYSNAGLEHINPAITARLAEKQGLGISDQERNIKKQLLKLKRSHPKDFANKLADGIANADVLQGYLLEIDNGLQKVEKAKLIAKWELYRLVEKNWSDLKLTALNENNDQSFKQFRVTLMRELNQHLNYRPSKEKDNFYHFEVGQWATIAVTPSYKNVNWKIEFGHKHDNNELQKGVEDIKVQEGGSSDSIEMPDDSSNNEAPPPQPEQTPAAPQNNQGR